MKSNRRIIVSMDDQDLRVMEGARCLRRYAVSTAANGMGCVPDSLRTPTGSFRICEKIGAGMPSGTIFKARVPAGQWRPGEAPDDDLVLTRILRLDGLEPCNANTFARFIYIHGTNREDMLGQPASHGCVRLANHDMIELFDLAEVGDRVEILPLTRRRGALLFIEFDGVLSHCHGILELARRRGKPVFDEVSALTAPATSGHVPDECIRRAIEIIRPDQTMCDDVARCCAASLADGASDVIAAARAGGWHVVLITRGPLRLLKCAAEQLEISHLEGLSLRFAADGSYSGCGDGFTTSGRLDLADLIADCISAMLPRRACLIGGPSTRHIAGVESQRLSEKYLTCNSV